MTLDLGKYKLTAMNLQTWLDDAVGRNAQMAQHFGVTPGAISQWRNNGVPHKRMKAVRSFTGGAVSLDDMLPDANTTTTTKPTEEGRQP